MGDSSTQERGKEGNCSGEGELIDDPPGEKYYERNTRGLYSYDSSNIL